MKLIYCWLTTLILSPLECGSKDLYRAVEEQTFFSSVPYFDLSVPHNNRNISGEHTAALCSTLQHTAALCTAGNPANCAAQTAMLALPADCRNCCSILAGHLAQHS